ncbi:Histone-lysine N-methyltransferase SMYD3 [Oopsacas minuta]|uniref:Histone-lysine N-methyltransferase SMYD3 n=1 Tax=Oopsacas minuta TaxID=111878 RepID=A0AAV7K6Y3_9METZ|nr:Histone-lysine N-methyltransferase SMYD3 [Oopsacas minuta]
MAKENTDDLCVPKRILERLKQHGISVAINEKGRGLIADRDFEAGTILIRSVPFSSAVAGKHIQEFCNKCGLKKEVKKCSRCNYVRYCSKDCQVSAWPSHKKECDYIKSCLDIFTKVLPINSLLVLRTLEMNEIEKLKQGIQDRELCPELEMLESHRDKFLELKLNDAKHTTYEIVTRTYKPFLRDRGYIITDNTVFDVHCKLAVNANAIQGDHCETVSSGLFPEQTLLNHSCRPNCLNCFRGLEVLLVASRDIICGEELTINYIDIIKPVWERRSQLKEKSHFSCVCQRCVEEELIEEDRTRWTRLDKIYEEYVNGNSRYLLNLSSTIIDLEFKDVQSDIFEVLVLRLTFEAYIELNEIEKALSHIQQLIEISQKYETIYSHDLSTVFVRQAELMAQLNLRKEAKQVLEIAKRPIEIIYGKEHSWYIQLLRINDRLI